QPGLTLRRDGREVAMRDWGRELLDEMAGLCAILDRGNPLRPYSLALEVQRTKLEDVARTPSARMMAELAATGESFAQLALRMSSQHKAYFLDMYPPNEARLAEFSREARESLEAHRAAEAADQDTFEDYLARYFAP
ncbi:MAG: glutamate--cysteine ligase, partial [Steroidobacteraceae bacterium]